MKKRAALALLATGLLLVSVTALIARKYGLADGLRGFLTGLGIGMELLAAYVLVRNKKMARQEERN